MNLLAFEILNEQRQTNMIKTSEERPIWALKKAGKWSSIKDAIAVGKTDLAQRELRTDMNALHFAALLESAETLNSLLQNGTISPNDTDQLQRTPLHLAAIKGNVDVTKMLLKQVDVDSNRMGGHPFVTCFIFQALPSGRSPDRIAREHESVECGPKSPRLVLHGGQAW